MLAVVSHDAGGAEVLSSYLRRQGMSALFVLGGPAVGIFQRKLGGIETRLLGEAIRECDSVLCGTSWQSDLELEAISMARGLGKRSTAFLDHWVDYHARFVRGDETHLPDEIWVGDPDAARLATAEFPDVPVRVVENPYFLDIASELEALKGRRSKDSAGLSVLYVPEPIAEYGRRRFGDPNHWGYDENHALRYFLTNVSALGCDVECIVIRPHPSEACDKYAWAELEFDLPIVRGGARTLLEEMVDADVVVGCESTALVVGLLAGKRVVSCIPPGGKPRALPHRAIVGLEGLFDVRTTGR